VGYILGVTTPHSDVIQQQLQHLYLALEHAHWEPILMGIICLSILFEIKSFRTTAANLSPPSWKLISSAAPLLVCISTILITRVWNLPVTHHVAIVGSIPQGLPSLISIHDWFPIDSFDQVLMLSFSVSVVGFMESVSIAQRLATIYNYEINPSQEFIALGMANLVGSAFHAYPVAGSLSRSAINAESGARTILSAIVAATLVGFILLFCTSWFAYLPMCVIASIIISGIIGLVDITEAMYLYQVRKFDFVVWLIACGGTMLFGVETGLVLAVTTSILVILYEITHPMISILGRVPSTTTYCTTEQHPDVEYDKNIIILHMDGPLFFANIQHVRNVLCQYMMDPASTTTTTTVEINENEIGDGHNDEQLLLPAAAASLSGSGSNNALTELDAVDVDRVENPSNISNIGNYNNNNNNNNMLCKYIIFDMSSISLIDTSAIHVLENVVTSFCQAAAHDEPSSRDDENNDNDDHDDDSNSRTTTTTRRIILFVNPTWTVWNLLQQSGFVHCIGPEYFFVSTATIHDAVMWCQL
jgi:MFS superfamily sulfate permease-like transporter